MTCHIALHPFPCCCIAPLIVICFLAILFLNVNGAIIVVVVTTADSAHSGIESLLFQLFTLALVAPSLGLGCRVGDTLCISSLDNLTFPIYLPLLPSIFEVPSVGIIPSIAFHVPLVTAFNAFSLIFWTAGPPFIKTLQVVWHPIREFVVGHDIFGTCTFPHYLVLGTCPS